MVAGYSAASLAKKLSLKDGMRVRRDGVPDCVKREIAREGLQLQLLGKPQIPIDAAHIVSERADLEVKLKQLRPLIDPAGMIWVSWPKKASKVRTDITEDTVGDVCLPMSLVDVKVCAVESIWSE